LAAQQGAGVGSGARGLRSCRLPLPGEQYNLQADFFSPRPFARPQCCGCQPERNESDAAGDEDAAQGTA
jgi:hypothetical protein